MRLVFAVFLASLLCAGARAQTDPAAQIDLELVLLADATGSIDDAEIMFQRRGYAEAITDPGVLSAIRGGLTGRIALTYVEWANAGSQHVVVDWTIIEDAASATDFAERLLAPPRTAYGSNAIGSALLKGKELIETNTHDGMRKVIDLSADSMANTSGPPIPVARREVLDAGIVINGLAVLCRRCSGRPIGYDLEEAFANGLIGGPRSFVITADSERTFAQAVRRKLILEIADLGGARRKPGKAVTRQGACRSCRGAM